MSNKVVDLSARSRVIHDGPLLLHYWELTPAEAQAFLVSPRAELEKIGVVLLAGCRIDTTVENHDKLGGQPGTGLTVLCQGTGHVGATHYKVSMHAHVRAAGEAYKKDLLHDRSEQSLRPGLSHGQRFNLAMLRHSMVSSPTYLKVFAYLTPLVVVDRFPRSVETAYKEFREVAELTAKEASGSTEFQKGLVEVGALVSGPPQPDYQRLYDHARRPGWTPLKTFLSVVLLRAIRSVIAHTCTHDVFHSETVQLLSDHGQLKAQITEQMNRFGPEFIPQLVVETETRASDSEEFDRSLTFAADAFAKLGPHIAPIYPGSGPTTPPWESDAQGVHLVSDSGGHWWTIPAIAALGLVGLQDVTIPPGTSY